MFLWKGHNYPPSRATSISSPFNHHEYHEFYRPWDWWLLMSRCVSHHKKTRVWGYFIPSKFGDRWCSKSPKRDVYIIIPWSHDHPIIPGSSVFSQKNPSIIPWFFPLGLQFIGHCYPNPCYPTSWVFWCEPPRKIKPGWEIPALEKWKFQASQGAEY